MELADISIDALLSHWQNKNKQNAV